MATADAQKPTSEERTSCRVLALDGGGSKGVYTLGVLKEVEAMAPVPLHKWFDLIYGTSTGSIIGTLLACGKPVDYIQEMYFQLIPDIMGQSTAGGRTKALIRHAKPLFGDKSFESCQTCLGIV